jgi:hypothetical protein
MCKEEFNLSEKRKELYKEIRMSMQGFLLDNRMDYLIKLVQEIIEKQDKEYCNRLKERFDKSLLDNQEKAYIKTIIDKLAGEQLK